MSTDKYAHLRPKKLRQCFRADGVPKKRYTNKGAKLKAAEEEGYSAYRCDECGRWHVGRLTPRSRT